MLMLQGCIAGEWLQAVVENDDGPAPLATQRCDHFRHLRSRHADHGEVRHARQRVNIWPDRSPRTGVSLPINLPHRPGEAGTLKVTRHPLTRADDRDSTGREQSFEISYAHVISCNNLYMPLQTIGSVNTETQLTESQQRLACGRSRKNGLARDRMWPGLT